MLLRIAARKSDLARLQAYRVGDALKKKHSELKIEYMFSSSLGDQNQNDPLWKMPEKGVFTQDLTKKLLSNECDIVVHSWKDLPTEENTDTAIVATLPRADARDLMLFHKDRFAKLNEGAILTVLSSSPRRAYNLKEFLSWALPKKFNPEFAVVRGNVATRLKKLIAGDGDALVIAKAAIDRLLEAKEPEFLDAQKELRGALKKCLWMIAPLKENPTAAAQGALAIEVRQNDNDIKNILAQINCELTFSCVQKERQVLKQYGGGCHQKIGISIVPKPYGEISYVRGEIDGLGSVNKTELLNCTPKKNQARPEEIYPLQMSESPFYERKPISVDNDYLSRYDLYVARFDALPDSYAPHSEQVIWVSGSRTWRKLAEIGVWVNGSHEALGEDDDISVSALLGRFANFIKLSHTETEGVSRFPIYETYELKDKVEVPDLNGKKHCFWASYSNFVRAIKKYPHIRAARHACGPGNTYKLIQKELGENAYLDIYLSYQDWLKQFE